MGRRVREICVAIATLTAFLLLGCDFGVSDAGPDCSPGTWRCHNNIVQLCVFDDGPIRWVDHESCSATGQTCSEDADVCHGVPCCR